MYRGKILFRISAIFVFLMIIFGCASSMMTKVPPVKHPESNHAVVTFLRPTSFGGAIQFGIWDAENFVGVLSANSYIQYLATPGEHIFMGRAENWSYVKANLEGGKNYYILGNVFPGVWKARIAFNPVTRSDGTTDEQIQDWLEKLSPTAIIPEKKDAYVQPRLPAIQKAVMAFKSGDVKYEVLEAADYR